MRWDQWPQILMGLSSVGLLPALLVVLPILLLRSMRQPLDKKFAILYRGLSVSPEPGSGLIFVRVHSYDGFLLWFTQTTHEGFTRPEDAQELLRRVFRYNLTRGLLAAGGLLVPFVSLPELVIQRRAVNRQCRDLLFTKGSEFDGDLNEFETVEIIDDSNLMPDSRRRFLGWATVTVWTLAVIQTLLFLAANIAATIVGDEITAEIVPGAIATVSFWMLVMNLTET